MLCVGEVFITAPKYLIVSFNVSTLPTKYHERQISRGGASVTAVYSTPAMRHHARRLVDEVLYLMIYKLDNGIPNINNTGFTTFCDYLINGMHR